VRKNELWSIKQRDYETKERLPEAVDVNLEKSPALYVPNSPLGGLKIESFITMLQLASHLS
jgi:hypothetical protein